jgi:hypothetical protein
MRRWMAGGVLSATALAGATILPTAGGAQETPGGPGEFQGEATFDLVSPPPVTGGETITVSDNACFEGTDALWWALRLEGEVQPTLKGTVPQAADGSWEVTFTVPDEGGDWLWFAVCLPPNVAAPDVLVEHIDAIQAEETHTELMEAWGVDGYLYYAHIVQVEGPTPTTPTTPPASTTTTVPAGPPSAPPAVPVPGDPTFTG